MSAEITAKEFADILADDALDTGSTEVIDSLRKAARAAIKAGQGALSNLSSSSMNGKSFSRVTELTPARVLEACRLALLLVAGDGEDDTEVSSTLPDFRQMIR